MALNKTRLSASFRDIRTEKLLGTRYMHGSGHTRPHSSNDNIPSYNFLIRHLEYLEEEEKYHYVCCSLAANLP